MFQRETTRQKEPLAVQAPKQEAAPRSPSTRLVQRAGCPCGGGCPRCRGSLPIQTKLALGGPQSSAEKEADRIAEQIVEPMPGQKTAGNRRQPISAVSTRITREAPVAESQEEPVAASLEGRIRSQLDGGEPLSDDTRAIFEPRLGADLSNVRLHQDSAANASANSLSARAFTVGAHIFFRAGEYAPGSKSGQLLLAHELVHVVQQSGGSDGGVVSRKTRRKPKEVLKEAPTIVELLGKPKLELGAQNETFFETNKKALLKVKFGKLADGQVEVTREKLKGKDKKDVYTIKKQAIQLNHPFFKKIASYAPQLAPVLVINVQKNQEITGFVGLQVATKLPSPKELDDKLKTVPQLFGISGFDLGALSKFENKLEAGRLIVSLNGLAIKLASVLQGSLSLGLNNGEVTFDAQVSVHAQGLAEGQFKLKRSAETGTVTGEADIGLTLPKNISGKVHVGWDGRAFDGKGEVGYQGEKFNGKITLVVMDEAKARQLDAEKKAASAKEAGKVGPDQPVAGTKPAKKGPPPKYVLFGDGNLDFSFTPWLTGNAQVLIDYKGDVTVIGEIRPQAEIQLFAEKGFDKELFKVEARAKYGLPVVGNIFVFANIGMSAFARIGPGKFYKIAVKGTYSTDPTKANDFSIEGTLNISAAAGLKVRAEGGAGLEILDHDLKAGVGINGIAGIKGYVEATPLIGYREVAKKGEDKKGQFFLKGDLEIAAQPFLGLSGDLFIEVDSPWWSPLPDKKWTWPLGSKEWPVGGSFGIGANTEYVFGSGQAPSLSFKPVQFSGDKFMSDIYSNKTSSKKPAQEKKGTWKEKNKKKAEPPPKKTEPATKPKPPKETAKGSKKNKPVGKTKSKAKVTAEGKSVDEMKRKAAAGRGKTAKGPKGAEAKEKPGSKKDEKQREANKDRAAILVKDMMAGGIRRRALLARIKKLKSSHKLKSISLDSGDDVTIVNSPPAKVKGKKFGAEADTFDSKTKRYDGKAVVGDKKTDGSDKQVKAVGTFKTKAPSHPTLASVFKPVMAPSAEFPFNVMPSDAPRPESVDVTIENPVAFSDKAREGGDKKSRTTGLVGKFGLLEEYVIAGGRERPKDQWEGGHLLGHQFGGPDSFDNLVPQRGNTVNRGLYAKIEDFTSKNAAKVKKGTSFMNIHYSVTYGSANKANVLQIQERTAKLTEKLSGKDLSREPSIIKGSHKSLNLTYTQFRKIKTNSKMSSLSVHLIKAGCDVTAAATISIVKNGWNVTDHAKKKVYLIKRDGKNMVVDQLDAISFFKARNATPTQKDKTATVNFVSRIPKLFNVNFEFKGIQDIEKASGGATNKGGKLEEPDYIIKSEDGKEGPKQDHAANQASVAANNAAAKPKPISIVVKFSLTPS